MTCSGAFINQQRYGDLQRLPHKTMEDQHERNEMTAKADKEVAPEQRTYAGYFSGGDLTFDPMKDLNLPGSYDEVLVRFRKLQGERAVEVMN